MKPYIQLVIKKQWLQYVFLISTILIALGTLWLGQKLAQQNFKIPIAIQDMDHSSASKKLIKDIEQNQYVTVKHLSHDDFYIDDLVKKKEVIASLEIPKDFSKHLKDNDLNKTLPLYSRDDFIGHIAMEIISRSLYEQQIPNIIHEHLDDMKQPQSLDKVKQSYYSHTPQSKIKSVAINKHAHQSISIGIVFVVVIFVSVIQILLHQRLKQNAPLGRLYLVPYSQLKLYLTYISVHVVILMLMLLMISLFMHQPLSILFYLKTLIIVLFYEAGIALLLFKINVLSHRIFSVIQILLHQRLKQNAPLGRLYLVPYSQLKLYLTYISVHVVILMLMLLMISLFMHQPLSILFYLKTLIIVLFYEAGIALLLFKINVLSHRIFMAIIYTVAIGIIYLWIQL